MSRTSETYSRSRDRIEAASRMIAGCTAFVVIWITHAADMQGTELEHTLIQYGAMIYIVGALSIGADLWLRPYAARSRNILSIVLDVSGVSAALYLGAGTVDPLALFYLWIMIGSGMVYGTRYLFLAGALCLAGFGFVFWASDYWQSKVMFSATIGGFMIVLGPYVATLITSLERARKRVVWQADHDELTRLLNRRAFERLLSERVPPVGAKEEHFLLYLDLDRFKVINDTAGHAAGDQALVDLVEVFSSEVTDKDLLARIGGDEFCLLLSNRNLEGARRSAERIRNKVASYRLAWGTTYHTLGVSAGVASSGCATDAASLIRLADAACYAAKNNGRNQVHVVDGQNADVDTQVIRKLVLPSKGTAALSG